jgi:hypothetical protein
MGVWDLSWAKGEALKWKKSALLKTISEKDRHIYLQKALDMQNLYEQICAEWESRAKRYGEDENGQRSE